MKTFPVDYPDIKCYNSIVDNWTIGRCREGEPATWNVPEKVKAIKRECEHPLLEIITDAQDVNAVTTNLLNFAHRLQVEPE